jgi:hypothetical protein
VAAEGGASFFTGAGADFRGLDALEVGRG